MLTVEVEGRLPGTLGVNDTVNLSLGSRSSSLVMEILTHSVPSPLGENDSVPLVSV